MIDLAAGGMTQRGFSVALSDPKIGRFIEHDEASQTHAIAGRPDVLIERLDALAVPLGALPIEIEAAAYFLSHLVPVAHGRLPLTSPQTQKDCGPQRVSP